MLQYCFCFMFWFLGQEACGITAPCPGMESTPLALEGKAPTSGRPRKSHLDWSLSVTSYSLSVLRKSPSPHFFTCSMRVTSSTIITGMLRRLKGVMGVHAQLLPGTSKRHRRVHKIIYIQWSQFCKIYTGKIHQNVNNFLRLSAYKWTFPAQRSLGRARRYTCMEVREVGWDGRRHWAAMWWQWMLPTTP